MNTLRTLSPSCFAALLLGTMPLGQDLTAQSIAVFPGDHATIPDGTWWTDWFPYSLGISRVMAVYESWDLGIPAGNQITRIGFRADGNTLSYGKSLQLEVRMGRTDRTSANLLPDYNNNWLGAPVTVFGPAVFTLPDLNNVLNPNPDGPFVWLNLTTPYAHDPTQNLLVEWRIYANSSGGAQFPYWLDRADFVSPNVSGPLGCPHSGAQIPSLDSRPTQVGGTWFVDLAQGPANQPVILFLNVGVPLSPPFPLSAILPGVAAACTVQLTPIALFSLSDLTGPSGHLTFGVPIPNDRAFNDLILSSQAVCFDFFAPGGFVVSNGDQLQIGIAPATTALYSQGSATSTTGSPWFNYGVVTLFGHN